VVVACNFTAEPQTVRFDLRPQGVAGTRLRTLMATPHDAEAASLKAVHLGPFGVYIGQVQ